MSTAKQINLCNRSIQPIWLCSLTICQLEKHLKKNLVTVKICPTSRLRCFIGWLGCRRFLFIRIWCNVYFSDKMWKVSVRFFVGTISITLVVRNSPNQDYRSLSLAVGKHLRRHFYSLLALYSLFLLNRHPPVEHLCHEENIVDLCMNAQVRLPGLGAL